MLDEAHVCLLSLAPTLVCLGKLTEKLKIIELQILHFVYTIFFLFIQAGICGHYLQVLHMCGSKIEQLHRDALQSADFIAAKAAIIPMRGATNVVASVEIEVASEFVRVVGSSVEGWQVVGPVDIPFVPDRGVCLLVTPST